VKRTGILRQPLAASAQLLGGMADRLSAIEKVSGRLIDLLDIATDLVGGSRLLLGGGGDLCQTITDALHRIDDVLQLVAHGQHAADIAIGLAAGFAPGRSFSSPLRLGSRRGAAPTCAVH
jgi:hypothetical protein